MSGQNSEPKVLIAIHNTTQDSDAVKSIVNQSYENILIETINNEVTAPKFFNDIISAKNKEVDLYGFIDGNCVLHKNCIELVVEKFLWSTSQFVGGLYSDYTMIQNGIKSKQYYNSYNLQRLKHNIINPYIFINGGIISRIFNEDLTTLYYYDCLLKIGINAMIYHIPKNLMDVHGEPKDVQEDIRKLQLNVRS